MSPSRRIRLALLTVAALLAGVLLGLWQGPGHLPRIALTLAAGAGVLAWATHQRRVPELLRLAGCVAGLVLAVLAWWFVPTVYGVNLWTVHRLLHEVETLPAGSVKEYRKHVARRLAARAAFPTYAADLERAERAWFERTADQVVRTAGQQKRQDPALAAATLALMARELARLEHGDAVVPRIEDARRSLLASGAEEP